PSTTEVGMNALAPVVDRGRLRLSLRPDRSKVEAIVRGEYRVSDPESRRRTIHDRVGGRTSPPIPFEMLLGRTGADLGASIRQARILVVHVDEIDAAGERGSGLTVFEAVLQKLQSAYKLLREAGARRFVFTA